MAKTIKMTATEKNTAIRNEGIAFLGELVKSPGVVEIGNGEYAIASESVKGRVFTIKVTAKAETFDLESSANAHALKAEKAKSEQAQRLAKQALREEQKALKAKMEAEMARIEQKQEEVAKA